MAKKIRVQEAHDFLCKFAPLSLAEDWDNVGLQVGSLQDTLTGILVSLDATEPVLWEAVEHETNLIVTHHPLFFRDIRSLDDSRIDTRLARLATQVGVNILSFHTNLDSTSQGLNDLLAKQINLTQLKPLLPATNQKNTKAGLGRVGKVPKTTLGKLMKRVSQKLGVKKFRYVGDPHHPINRVAVMTGSGAGYFREALAAGADVLITGDLKYHHALDALAEGIPVIDIGHFTGEIGMVELVAKKLKAWAKQKKIKIKVHQTKTQSDPINYWP